MDVLFVTMMFSCVYHNINNEWSSRNAHNIVFIVTFYTFSVMAVAVVPVRVCFDSPSTEDDYTSAILVINHT